MTPPFRLVSDPVSHDTVEALQTLLDQAKSGKLIGLAYAAMYKQREFAVDTAGEAHRSPVFARGMLACLDDKLRC